MDTCTIMVISYILFITHQREQQGGQGAVYTRENLKIKTNKIIIWRYFHTILESGIKFTADKNFTDKEFSANKFNSPFTWSYTQIVGHSGWISNESMKFKRCAALISSFKWQKMCLILNNRHHPNWITWLTKHQPKPFFFNFSRILFLLKHEWA